jgi:hypothetical protein
MKWNVFLYFGKKEKHCMMKQIEMITECISSWYTIIWFGHGYKSNSSWGAQDQFDNVTSLIKYFSIPRSYSFFTTTSLEMLVRDKHSAYWSNSTYEENEMLWIWLLVTCLKHPVLVLKYGLKLKAIYLKHNFRVPFPVSAGMVLILINNSIIIYNNIRN